MNLKYYATRIAVWLMPFTLIACGFPPKGPIRDTQVIEHKVPVATKCVRGEKPGEPTSLRDRFSPEEWASLSTDQRENLSQAQALMRKLYGDELTVATAGCE